MKLTDNIHLLRLDFEIPLSPEKKLARFVNVIMIFGNSITLIDAGTKGSDDRIFAYIEENNRKVSEIGTILLSNSHPDHIGAAQTIRELTNCRVFAHESVLGIMIKLADENTGSIENGTINKTLTRMDKERLNHGVAVCSKMFLKLGVAEKDIFLGTVNAGHLGGMFPLTIKETETFHNS